MRRRPPPAFVVAACLGILALAWAAYLYAGYVADRVDAGEPPHDLQVFLRAASAVLHGRSPYGFDGDSTYAYPPLLAFLATPLHTLGIGAATASWYVVSLAAVAVAVWLLGVRDWRCYCLVPLYPTTRSAVGLGTVDPLLLLATAAAWRWRDQLVRPAAAVGAAIALKLFLWPLAVWLAVTRRMRAAVVSVVFAFVLALVPWAAIGFAGLGDYPSLLDRLRDAEATSSYSVVALGVRAHLPESVATVAALAVAAGLLLAAARVARDAGRAPRERDAASLTLVLAAAFAGSPIVWMHYFLLLIVPVALVRPRLSLLWLVPFAYEPLGASAWPAGDARKLALALATTAVLVVAGARRQSGRRRGAPAARVPRPGPRLGRAAREPASPSRPARPSP